LKSIPFLEKFGCMDSRLAQSYKVFVILKHIRPYPRTKSGVWEERDEKYTMEKNAEQASIFKRSVSFHVLAFTRVAFHG
jgi:hypothetical protein